MSNFVGIWNLLKTYSFTVDPVFLHDDLLCHICHKLMIDACQSICGCQFCHKCISDYLGSISKQCPSNKDECLDEFLLMDSNVFRNIRMNKQISNLRVFCPNEWCQSTWELSGMEEHMRVCTTQLMRCPYVAIGCNNEVDDKDGIFEHFNNESMAHAHLLIECFQNLRNEVNGMKDNCESNPLEFLNLKEDYRNLEMNVGSRIEELIERNGELAEKVAEQRGEMEYMKAELNSKEMEYEKLMIKIAEQKKEIMEEIEKKQAKVSKKLSDFSSIIEEQSRVIENQKIEIFRQKKEIIEQKKKIMEKILSANKDFSEQNNNMELRLSTMMEELEAMKLSREWENGSYENEDKSKEMDMSSELDEVDEVLEDVDFIWRIRDWTMKVSSMKETFINSKPFYSNNYKLCLYLWVYPDGDIRLGCMIMKGEHDDLIEWPMKQPVTLSILEHNSYTPHNSVTMQYDTYEYKSVFDRPQKDMNDYGCSTKRLLRNSRLPYDESILNNDLIIVSCVIGYE